ncbi:hypothetical protein [Catenulispora pinisilvae]|uniref:hypothetical protein n=1 Tax=Catenulispora pinisilvae TaxID=2705253 RepID=UPI001891694A|nr:hypothetical protein [Catenulispora pinisilvae]
MLARSGAALIAALAMIVSYAPASNAAPAAPAAPQMTVVATSSAHSLTLDEVKAMGLEKYVDTSHYKTSPAPTGQITISLPGATTAPAKAVRRPASDGASPQASGCWSNHEYIKYTAALWPHPYIEGYADVTWCGGGTWITYANSTCGGDANWPSYQYESCNIHADYGAGWNVYNVDTHWDLCTDVLLTVGNCVIHKNPEMAYQYNGDGGYLRYINNT